MHRPPGLTRIEATAPTAEMGGPADIPHEGPPLKTVRPSAGISPDAGPITEAACSCGGS